MTPAQILREAATLPWAQGGLAFSKDGRECHPTDDEAACFCPEGAIYRAARSLPAAIRIQAKTALYQAIGGDIVLWNDQPGRKAEEVAAKMIEAAERLERVG